MPGDERNKWSSVIQWHHSLWCFFWILSWMQIQELLDRRSQKSWHDLWAKNKRNGSFEIFKRSRCPNMFAVLYLDKTVSKLVTASMRRGSRCFWTELQKHRENRRTSMNCSFLVGSYVFLPVSDLTCMIWHACFDMLWHALTYALTCFAFLGLDWYHIFSKAVWCLLRWLPL